MTWRSRDDSNRDTRRRFEQWARKPQCGANAISAVYNIPMHEVARGHHPNTAFWNTPLSQDRVIEHGSSN
jgi:hypothetical protein